MLKIKLFLILALIPIVGWSANYTLNIINVDEAGANNRIKFAYPAIEYNVVIAAEGGAYPFVWELTVAPSGMVIDSHTGIITWASPTATGSPHTVTVKVTDKEGNTDTESYTLTVTDSIDRFLFIQDGYSGTKSGTISQPYEDISEIWDTVDDTDKILILRSGTYHIPHAADASNRGGCQRVPIGVDDPIAIIGYPGETATIDHERAESTGYAFLPSKNDFFFGNLTFTNIWLYGIVIEGRDYFTVFDCEFNDAYTTDGHGNQAYINYMAGGSADYNVICANRFNGPVTEGYNFQAIETYTVSHMILAGNTINNLPNYGIFFKDRTYYSTIRNNDFTGCGNAIGIYGQYGSSDIEICFNYTSGNSNGLSFDVNGSIDDIYVYRNTFDDNCIVRMANADTYTLDVSFLNNVIQNAYDDSGTIGTNAFYRNRTYYRYVSETEYTGIAHAYNLEGASGLVDASGLLVNRDYVGTYGWEIAESEYYEGSGEDPPVSARSTASGTAGWR
jgi:hypothetical protein